jgi:two-component system OmpR family sensor kinase
MSLRARLLLAVGAVALAALLAADVATYYSLRSSVFGRVDETLSTIQVAVMRSIGWPDEPPVGTSGTQADGAATASEETSSTATQPRLPERIVNIAPGSFVQVRSADGTPISGQVQPAAVAGGSTYTPELPATIAGISALPQTTAPPSGFPTARPSPGSLPPQIPGVTFTTSAVESDGPRFRVRASLLPGGEQLIVALPLTEAYATLNRLLLVEVIVTLAALAAAMGLGWWLVRVGLRPLADVERTAEAIAAGELHQRVPVEHPRTEVGRLATVLNTMLGRIQEAFAERDETEAELRESEDRMRRFVGDASHELRTPLAAVSAYAELLDDGVVDAEQDQARVVGGIRDETARMGGLVQDLLLLARMDEGRPMASESTELVSLVADAIHAATTVGPEWPVTLRAGQPVEVRGDSERLRQVVANLLSNVRMHTPAGTRTVVTVREEAGEAVMEVADDGPGLTEEQAGRVFERFYRADKSRSRAHGGAGLGLSIVAAIVDAHGGSVSAAPAAGGGAMFTVRLPLNTAPQS